MGSGSARNNTIDFLEISGDGTSTRFMINFEGVLTPTPFEVEQKLTPYPGPCRIVATGVSLDVLEGGAFVFTHELHPSGSYYAWYLNFATAPPVGTKNLKFCLYAINGDLLGVGPGGSPLAVQA